LYISKANTCWHLVSTLVFADYMNEGSKRGGIWRRR
jgi:hypothetical protein